MSDQSQVIGTWRCQNCGEGVEPGEYIGLSWRWNGERFQHACGDAQAGHFDANLFPWTPADMVRFRGETEQTIAHWRDRATAAESALTAETATREALRTLLIDALTSGRNANHYRERVTLALEKFRRPK